jgi:hypothetical protein
MSLSRGLSGSENDLHEKISPLQEAKSTEKQH